MSPPVRPRVFLSYGTRDASALAGEARAHLDANGFDVWQDTERIRPGHAWGEAEIRDAIHQSAAVVALLSPHATREAASSPDRVTSVCINELYEAKYFAKLPIVPVMAVMCRVPFLVNELHYLDLTNSAAWPDRLPRLAEALGEAIQTGKSPARPNPLGVLRPFDFALQMESRRGFVGRDWLFRDLANWRKEVAGKRAAVVTGDPGIGKTALSAELATHSSAAGVLAVHFCDSRYSDMLDPGRFVQNIAYQLAGVLPDYAEQLQARPDALSRLAAASTDPPAALRDGVLIPLKAIRTPSGGPFLVLVDALDEAMLTGRADSIAELLARGLDLLPPWLKVVTTARREPAVMARLTRLKEKELRADLPENRDDLRTYLAGRLAEPVLAARLAGAGVPVEQVADPIAKQAAGNFLYAVETLRAIEEGDLEPGEVGSLPPGLGGLYFWFFTRRFPDPARTFADPRAVLAVLVAAEVPLTREQLAAATGFPVVERLNPVMRILAGYAPERDGRFGLYHRSLADWLVTDTDFQVDVRAGHAQLADTGWREFETGVSGMSEYAMLYLPTHLEHAGQADRQERLLTDYGYLSACAEHYQRLGNVARAEAIFEGAVARCRRKVAGDATDSNQSTFFWVQIYLGDFRVALGDLDGAAEVYEEAEGRMRELAASEPTDTDWQRDVSVSLDRVGDVRVARGDLDGALAAFEEGLTIRPRLAESDPRNAGWQRDVAYSYHKLAEFAEKKGDESAAREHRRLSWQVYDGMRRAEMHLHPQDRRFLAWLDSLFGPPAAEA